MIVEDDYTANKTEDGYLGQLTADSIIILADRF